VFHPDAIAEAGAIFKSLAESRADTTTMHGRLMLAAWAAWQSSSVILIGACTGEGRAGATAKGCRPAKLTLHQRQTASARRASGATR